MNNCPEVNFIYPPDSQAKKSKIAILFSLIFFKCLNRWFFQHSTKNLIMYMNIILMNIIIIHYSDFKNRILSVELHECKSLFSCQENHILVNGYISSQQWKRLNWILMSVKFQMGSIIIVWCECSNAFIIAENEFMKICF